MAVPLTARQGLARLHAASSDFARTSLGFLPVVLLLRGYELLVARSMHALPSGSAAEWARAALSDVALACWVAAALAVPVLATAHWRPAVARALHRVALVALAIVAAALAQYFAVTQVPLGADLYGYSWSDLRETVGASTGISVLAVVSLVLFGAAAWVLPGLARRLPWPPAAGASFGVAILAVVFAPSLLVPSPAAFSSDTAYFVAVNKTGWLGRRSVQHVVSTWRTARAAAGMDGYPLMRRVEYVDVLGPRLALGPVPPNIVIVIVEGLGRDFTGPRAQYGGFTPFLDSLADRSLSWDNFLSTSGRTFGILPSLLGSLPFGSSGFMELGARMPAHASLMTLLRERGYETNYFTGTNGQFDRIDAFMEREGVGRFVDASSFPPSYALQPASIGGDSWGYPDHALFARSLDLIGTASQAPRLDVYLTITTHEPFIPPDSARYRARFEQRLAALPADDARRETFREYAGVFQTLLYTDDALRGFLRAYEAREDYARTIFLITGDHRLIPVPPSRRMARYHVPFLVFSPMLRAPHHIGAVSSHFDVIPSLLALLAHGYGMTAPDTAAWLGTGLDTVTRFRHAHAVPLMRTKNELDEYLDGTLLLSGDQFFRLDSTFTLTTLGDGAERASVSAALDRFRAINRYVTTRDRVIPATAAGVTRMADPVAAAREDSIFRALGLERREPAEAFAVARELAATRNYDAARAVARRLLRDAPSYHDARALLGRTFGWERRFDEARVVLNDLVRRAPMYADGYAAVIELDIFEGSGQRALAGSEQALADFPRHAALLYEKARALELLGRRPEALAVLDTLRQVAPADPDAEVLRRRLRRP
ncbi:MAG: sulfatase-like hydrolase/transferase [Gemmatimonadaceae bacterium]